MKRDCENIRDRLEQAALDLGPVSDADRAALHEHLTACADCRRQHARLTALAGCAATLRTLERSVPESVVDHSRRAILAAVRARASARPAPSRVPVQAWLWGLAGASAAVALTLTVAWFMAGRPHPRFASRPVAAQPVASVPAQPPAAAPEPAAAVAHNPPPAPVPAPVPTTGPAVADSVGPEAVPAMTAAAALADLRKQYDEAFASHGIADLQDAVSLCRARAARYPGTEEATEMLRLAAAGCAALGDAEGACTAVAQFAESAGEAERRRMLTAEKADPDAAQAKGVYMATMLIFREAMVLAAQGDEPTALSYYDLLRRRYPGTEGAAFGLQRLGAYHERLHHWREACDYYSQIRAESPAIYWQSIASQHALALWGGDKRERALALLAEIEANAVDEETKAHALHLTGSLLDAAGDRVGATRAFTEVGRRWPGTDQAAQSKLRLQHMLDRLLGDKRTGTGT